MNEEYNGPCVSARTGKAWSSVEAVLREAVLRAAEAGTEDTVRAVATWWRDQSIVVGHKVQSPQVFEEDVRDLINPITGGAYPVGMSDLASLISQWCDESAFYAATGTPVPVPTESAVTAALAASLPEAKRAPKVLTLEQVQAEFQKISLQARSPEEAVTIFKDRHGIKGPQTVNLYAIARQIVPSRDGAENTWRASIEYQIHQLTEAVAQLAKRGGGE